VLTNSALEPPSTEFVLGLRMALNLKKLSFYCWFLVIDRRPTRFMEWLLQELVDPERMPRRMAKDRQCPSTLASILVRLPVTSATGTMAAIAGALSEAFLDERHYPMLNDVLIHLVTVPRDAPGAMVREEVALAMLPSVQKGIRLLWE
jgi:hypothetical protein